MPGDRLLGTLLGALQSYTDQQDTPRLLGSAASLLTTLNNPLNVTLLASQLLSAPAIWDESANLQTCLHCLSAFHSAAQAIVRHENALRGKSEDGEFAKLQLERTLPKEDWIKAVINGADDHSPRWRHSLLLGGLLLGFGRSDEENISRHMRSTLEEALAKATNLALEDLMDYDSLGRQSITLALNHCFPLLSDYERARLNYDLLLPALMRSTFDPGEGLLAGRFISAIDNDIRPLSHNQFEWSEHSPSFVEVKRLSAGPITSALGPLSRLIAHAIDRVRNPWLVISAVKTLELFAHNMHLRWRQNKLSEIDASEEGIFLNHETIASTAPQLWKLLRAIMFAAVIILRGVAGRVLNDGSLASPEGTVSYAASLDHLLMMTLAAPDLATRALRTLRSLFFITARQSSSSFSQYTFAYLTAMDILAAHPYQAEAFVKSITSPDHSRVPPHPLDRNLDLYFLNTAEHFTLVLTPSVTENLIIPATSPYLAAGGNNNLLPIFEAAHSVMLAVFSAPQNAQLIARHLPFYIEALFNVYPHNLSARQFRLAFKTLLRLASPPSKLAATDPLLSATLLELLSERANNASTAPLFPDPSKEVLEDQSTPELSEQAVLVLTILDTLPQLELMLLDEWLPFAVELVNSIEDPTMRHHCREHFWQTLMGGEMDPGRSELCHAWWSTEGGREMLLFDRAAEADHNTMMNGALPIRTQDNKL